MSDGRDLAEAIAVVEAAHCTELRERLIRAERHIAHLEYVAWRRRRLVRRVFNRKQRLILQQAAEIIRLKEVRTVVRPAGHRRRADRVDES